MSCIAITEYPSLLKALDSREKILYLCGTGASVALGNHTCS